MERLQSYKFELKPSGHVSREFFRIAGCCRFVWNRALALKKEVYSELGKSISYVELAALLPGWKKEEATKWLKDAPSQALQASMKHLDVSYKNFFSGRADFPQFKRKGGRDSFHFPQGFKVDEAGRRIKLPKIGWVNYRRSRFVEGVVRSITVSREGDKWVVSILTRRVVEKPVHPAKTIVGIDVGCTIFAVLSDGSKVAPAKPLASALRKIKKAQRRLSKKVKFSRNWVKERKKVAKLHRQVGYRRKDFLNKTSTAISKNHAVVVLEDLKVANMSRSAKGTLELPGRNVKQKSGLNRTILDQGWGEFRRQLEYKQAWSGGLVVAVDPRNTSRTCSCCGHVAAENRKTQSSFSCVVCGHSANADVNAAKVILAAGHAVLACGDVSLETSAKQEPTCVGSIAA